MKQDFDSESVRDENDLDDESFEDDDAVEDVRPEEEDPDDVDDATIGDQAELFEKREDLPLSVFPDLGEDDLDEDPLPF